MIHGVVQIEGPYIIAKSGRMFATVYYENGRKRYLQYPRLLVEWVLERELDPKTETVDHIDGNVRNNEFTNLRILPIGKHVSDDVALYHKKIDLVCPWCRHTFKCKSKAYARAARNGQREPCCSRLCAGRYRAALLRNEIDEAPAARLNKILLPTVAKQADLRLQKLVRRRGMSEESVLLEVREIQNAYSSKHKRPAVDLRPTYCTGCGKKYTPKDKRQKFHSLRCSQTAHRKVARPSASKLKDLVWTYPAKKLAEKLGVSDSAIAKWCRQLGIEKPGRGYWAKLEASTR